MGRRPKIVVPENMGSQAALVDRLVAAGAEVLRVSPSREAETAARLAADADAFIAFSHLACPSPVLEAGSRLRAVLSPVIGVDTIEVAGCTERGIVVAHGAAPENFLGMAEAAVLSILAVAKELNRKQRSLRAGQWRPSPLRGFMLRGRTLGFIGFGRIARGVAARLQGWEVRLLAYDPLIPPDAIIRGGATPADLPRLLRDSDVVSIHVVLTAETRNLVGAHELAQMKPGSAIVNTSRGGVVDEAALARALESGHLMGAAVDTFADEPMRSDNPLLAVDPDKIVLTGHCIGHGIELGPALVAAAFENLSRIMRGEDPLYLVNPEALPAWRERIAGLDQAFGRIAFP